MSENAIVTADMGIENPSVVIEASPEVIKEEVPVESPAPKSRRAKANRAEAQAPVADAKSDDKVILFVDHPIHWPTVGSLNKGYNLVNADVAEKWIAKGWARAVTPAEVTKAFGA